MRRFRLERTITTRLTRFSRRRRNLAIDSQHYITGWFTFRNLDHKLFSLSLSIQSRLHVAQWDRESYLVPRVPATVHRYAGRCNICSVKYQAMNELSIRCLSSSSLQLVTCLLSKFFERVGELDTHNVDQPSVDRW